MCPSYECSEFFIAPQNIKEVTCKVIRRTLQEIMFGKDIVEDDLNVSKTCRAFTFFSRSVFEWIRK